MIYYSKARFFCGMEMDALSQDRVFFSEKKCLGFFYLLCCKTLNSFLKFLFSLSFELELEKIYNKERRERDYATNERFSTTSSSFSFSVVVDF